LVVATLTTRTTPFPVMMTELRRLWHLLDVNDIRIRHRGTSARPGISGPTTSIWCWTTTTRSHTRVSSIPCNPRGGHILSTASRPWRTHSYNASTQRGSIPNAKTSIACTDHTTHANATQTTATRLGDHYHHFARSYESRERKEKRHPTVTKDSKQIQSITKVLLTTI
jgi:hypothetical protein